MHCNTFNLILERNIALIIEMWQSEKSRKSPTLWSLERLALSNQQVGEAENPHPSECVQVQSLENAWRLLDNFWRMLGRLRSRALLLRRLLLSWFHRWRSHFLCLKEKNEREKWFLHWVRSWKLEGESRRSSFHCACSLFTTPFVIGLNTLRLTNESNIVKKYAINCYCVTAN